MIDLDTTVAGYRLEEVLGRGGMGVVYEATQISLNRRVALKVLASDLTLDPSFRERFRREGQVQAALDHPNIIPVYDSGELDKGLFLAMRLVRGPTLKDLVIARELEGARTLRLLRPIADALDAAHEVHLIHRDVKPQNILVAPRDHPYLADFGLTKGVQDSGLTKTGQFVGTLDYIAPEQIRGEPASPQSDIYALAAVLYECLTGIVPYPRASDAAVLYAHLSDDPPLVTEQRPELPPGLDHVICRSMSKDWRTRHETASGLIADAELAFGKSVRAVITPPVRVQAPEDLGVRPPDERVPTPKARVPPISEPGRPEPDEPVTSTTEAGLTEAGLTEAGLTEAGLTEAGLTEAGLTEAGLTEAGLTDAGLTEAPSAGQVRGSAEAPRSTPAAERSPRPGAVVVTLGALVLVVAVVGFLLGRSGSGGSAPALANSASSQDVALRFPAGWQRTATARIPTLEVGRDAVTVAPRAGPPGSGVVAGLTRATGPTLLPAGLRAALRTTPRPDARVKLGKLEAYRYDGLRPRGAGRVATVYAAPTSVGVATVICYAPPSAPAGVPRDCERIAGSLRLSRGAGFPLGPSASYARKLNAALGAFRRARQGGRRALAAARSSTAQARGAERLAAAANRAGDRLAKVGVSPASQPAARRVVAALRATAAGYRRLARAARADRADAFAAAAASVGRAEAALDRAVTELRRSGYRIAR